MDITQTLSPTANRQNAGALRAAPPELSSDFETFLRMLTVQMQNQDPLNPVDSADYAVQLATFSSVEQQVKTNDLLQALADQIGGSSIQQLSGWIGMEALVRAPVQFDGTPVNLRPDYAENADAAVLLVRDDAGTVVQRVPITLSTDSIEWAGVDDQGAPLPNGVYRFDIESFRAGSLIDSRIAPTYSRIDEARTDNNEILLRLSDGSEIVSTLVTGLRAPG